MGTERTYPYQNLDLTDIKTEQWEDIPGLDGYYRISNFGRTKRLAFEILCVDGKIRRMKEKILMPELAVQENHSVHDQNYFLRIKIMQAGVTFNFSVARLVYHLFVTSFDLSDQAFVVIARDGNGKNIRLKNLRLVNISQKQIRMFEMKRHIKHLPDAYDEFINQGLIKSTNPSCKQISQYTLKGLKVQTYPSTKVAAQVLGISEAGINSVLKGRQVFTGGYVWRYGKEKLVDMNALREQRSFHRKLLTVRNLVSTAVKGSEWLLSLRLAMLPKLQVWEQAIFVWL